MGNHLNQGIGYGDATVFNPTPGIQQFSNILAQQKAEKQAKDQALINQMAQLKPDQLRDADKQDYLGKVNDWKQTAMNANQLPRNSRDRLDALASAQQKYQELQDYIGESKKEAAHENAISNSLIQNPHLFSDDAHQKLIKSMQSPMSDANFIPGNQYQSLERYIDPVKQDDGFDKANKVLLKSQDWSNPIQTQRVDKQGNKTGVTVHNEREVSPEDLLSTHAHMYTLSPDTKNYIDKKYAAINGTSPQETMMLRLKQNALDRGDLVVGKDGTLQSGVSEKTKPEFKANRVDNYYVHHDYALAHPTTTQQQSNLATPLQSLAAQMHSGNQDAGKQFTKLIPSTEFKPGEAPDFNIVNGQHVISIPAKYTQKAIQAMKIDRDRYQKSPETAGGVLGFGGTPVPYEQSKSYQKVITANAPKQPAQTYTLPSDPIGYNATLADIANKNGIPVSAINEQVGGKGKHGYNPLIQNELNSREQHTAPVVNPSKIKSIPKLY